MRVHSLSVTDFRNYSRGDITLSSGINVFLGPNGQGKTNLIEAIHYLSSLSSHRISADVALIKKGSDQAIIRSEVASGDRKILLQLELNRASRNRAQVNQNPAQLRDFPRYLSSVLFAPEDLQLVRGEPEHRRNFLDDLVVNFLPRMSGVYSDYDRVIKQRNSLLKSLKQFSGRATETSTLELWDEKLISLGTEISTMREELVVKLRPLLEANYHTISGVNHAPQLRQKLSVYADAPDHAFVPARYSTDLTELIKNQRAREIERGATLFGPHRDDVEFFLNDLPAKGYASHGETWSFVLALKLASAQLLKEESALGDPVIILDDVFAELDSARRTRLAERITAFEQCLITCAVEEDLPESVHGRVFSVSAGTVGDHL